MTALTFYATPGQVWMSDGPWAAKLTQAQADVLLDIFDSNGAVSSFNALYEAVQAAGYLTPMLSGKPLLRLVSSNSPKEIVREQLRRSLEASRGRTEHLCGDIFDAATITSPNPDNAA